MTGTALLGAWAGGTQAQSPAQSQPAPAAPAQMPGGIMGDDADTIVVTGARPRGSVVGTATPEDVLDPGDVRALGVGSVQELLAEIAPQTNGTRGGSPLVLLEGRRVSSFREIARIPSEAIARVDILPEETALRYGYPPSQKVVNIVLRERFNALTMEVNDRFATDGGGNEAELEMDLVSINRGQRLSIGVDIERQAKLRESDRAIPSDDAPLRTLIPSRTDLELSATWARPLADWIDVSINGEITTSDTEALTGSQVPSVAVAASSPYAALIGTDRFTPTLPGAEALIRSGSDRSGKVGATVNASGKVWNGTFTATYDRGDSRTLSDRGLDLASYEAALAAGDPAADPSLPLGAPFLIGRPGDSATSSSDIGAADLTVNGSPFSLPAGDVSLTARVGGSITRFRSDSLRQNIAQSADLARDIALGALNIDVPVFDSPSPFLGEFALSGSLEAQSLSDFGTLTSHVLSARWEPRDALSLNVSYEGREGAPTLQQLGNPVFTTPNVQLFDYASGTTASVARLSGGNPDLLPQDAQDWRIGLVLKPFGETDLRFTVDYNRSRIDNAIIALPGATEAVQLAFPDRFQRDLSGQLIGFDSRPVNIASRESSEIRWGVTFTKRLKTSQARIEAFRSAIERAGGIPEALRRRTFGGGGGAVGFPAGAPGRNAAADVAHGTPPGGGGRGGFGGSGGGRGGPGGGAGGGAGGRLFVSLFHSWHLTDRATLRDGQPSIDLLDGGTLGSASGQPRHEVELRTGVFQNGFGLRLSGDWQSATRVFGDQGGTANALRFSDLATVSIRVFADLGRQPSLLFKHPWLRGVRVSLDVDNVFDTRQRVTDSTGATPLAFSPGYLDPIGRTVRIELRKQFF